MKRTLVTALVLLSIGFLAAGTYIKQGRFIMEDCDNNLEAFDFSLGQVVRTPRDKGTRITTMQGHFIWDKYNKGIGIGTTDPSWKNIKDLGAMSLASVTTVTPLGFEYVVPLIEGHVYCIRTRAYNYALVRLIRYLDNGKKAEFEWKYNINGGLAF